MSFFKFAAHDATISSIIDAYPSIGYKAVATKLAESGIHVKPSTMQKYMQPLSELGVTYLSMSDLIAREATIASIIDADSGIHVKRKTMENYMKSWSVITKRNQYVFTAETLSESCNMKLCSRISELVF